MEHPGDAAARTALINAELRRLEPDLVALQEVLPEQLPGLIEGTGLHGTHQSQTSATAPPYVDRYGGTAIATRQPHRVAEVLDQRGPIQGAARTFTTHGKSRAPGPGIHGPSTTRWPPRTSRPWSASPATAAASTTSSSVRRTPTRSPSPVCAGPALPSTRRPTAYGRATTTGSSPTWKWDGWAHRP
ncbi:endonuclease/exonuclease/phosphatase family protein [Streptomyces sp. NPDC102384]|uniref:endonuclease/exonuclease/phosphatase family protein n=1 Tax=Streptomyces sp. NPDC102384 TaxID=3366166 RepID=UPI00381853C5